MKGKYSITFRNISLVVLAGVIGTCLFPAATTTPGKAPTSTLSAAQSAADTGEIELTISGVASPAVHLIELSRKADPFGFHPASVHVPGYPGSGFADATNIGVGWTREGLYAYWFIIQPDLDRPVYDFTRYDQQWRDVPTSVNILANIAPQEIEDMGRCLPGSWIPVDVPQYIAFVKATVERYDGDGVNDMPGLSNPIQYWQVVNEPNLPANQGRADFADLQIMTYQAIKQACPDCTVLMGGVAGWPDGYLASFDAYYAPILAELGGQYADIFDFHWYGTARGEYRLRDTVTGEDVLDHIRATLTASGFSPDMPIWITEMGSYSGDPVALPDIFPFQSERQQAGDYFRRFIYPLSRGVDKIFPAFGLMEGLWHNDTYFDHTGLIYDGYGPGDPGLGVRKLGYYTYKKMTETLEGADWDTFATLHDGTGSDHTYLFRVEKDGQPIYIAWWDTFDEPSYTPGHTKPITVTGLVGTSITVTHAIPAAKTGKDVTDYVIPASRTSKDVTDYAIAFTVTTYPIVDGAATLPLGEDPVYVTILQ